MRHQCKEHVNEIIKSSVFIVLVKMKSSYNVVYKLTVIVWYMRWGFVIFLICICIYYGMKLTFINRLYQTTELYEYDKNNIR